MISMIKRWLGFSQEEPHSPALRRAEQQDARDRATLDRIRTEINLIAGERQAITAPMRVISHGEGSAYEQH